MQHQSEQSTRIIREVIIREQLMGMFPDIERVYLLFCAHELATQIQGFQTNSKFEGGKC
jgi:hypothetical protein